MIYLSYLKDGSFNGFRIEGIHEDIPKPFVCIDEELWQKLLYRNMNKFINLHIPEKKVFTIEDIGLFESIDVTPEVQEQEISIDRLRQGLQAVLKGDMQSLAYALYPEDFIDITMEEI